MFQGCKLAWKRYVTEIQLNPAASLVFHDSQAEQERHYKKITGLGWEQKLKEMTAGLHHTRQSENIFEKRVHFPHETSCLFQKLLVVGLASWNSERLWTSESAGGCLWPLFPQGGSSVAQVWQQKPHRLFTLFFGCYCLEQGCWGP